MSEHNCFSIQIDYNVFCLFFPPPWNDVLQQLMNYKEQQKGWGESWQSERHG